MPEHTIAINITAEGRDAEGVLSKIGGSLQNFGKIAAIGAGVAVAGITAIGGAILGLAVAEARDEAVARSFENMAKSIGTSAEAMTKDLKAATMGMLSNDQLMYAANKLVAMGMAKTSQEATKMAEAAVKLGVSMGQDAGASLENFFQMIERGSARQLPQFGISLEAVNKRVAELTKASGGGGISQEKLSGEVAKHAGRLQDLQNQLQITTMRQSELTGKAKESARVSAQMKIDKLTGEINQEQQALNKLGQAHVGVTKAVKAMSQQEAFKQAVMEQATKQMEKVGDQSENAQVIMGQLGATIDDLKDTIGTAFLPVLKTLLVPLRDLAMGAGPKVQAWAEGLAAIISGTVVPGIKGFIDKVSLLAWYIGSVGKDGKVFTDTFWALPTPLKAIAKVIGPVVKAIGDIGGAVSTWISGTAIPGLKGLVNSINWKAIGGFIDDVATGLWDIGGKAATWITGTAIPAISDLLSSINWADISKFIGDVAGGLADIGGKAVTWITDTAVPKLQELLSKVKWADIAKFIGDIALDLSHIGGAAVTWITGSALPALTDLLGKVEWAEIGTKLSNLATGVWNVGNMAALWVRDKAIPAFQDMLSEVPWERLATNIKNLAMPQQAAAPIGLVPGAERRHTPPAEPAEVAAPDLGPFQKIAEVFGPTIQRLNEAVTGFLPNLSQLSEHFTGLGESAGGLGTALAPLIGIVAAVVGFVVKLIGELAAQFITRLPEALGGSIDILSGSLGILSALIGGTFKLIGAIIQGDWSGAWNALLETSQGLQDGVNTILKGILTIVDNVFGAIWDTITNTINDLLGTNIASWEEFKTMVVGFFTAIGKGATEKFNDLKTTVWIKIAEIKHAIWAFKIDFEDAGKALVDGLISGVRERAGKLVDAAKGVVNDAIAAAKKLLGIGSPSTVFADVGANMMEGMALGVNQGMQEPLAVLEAFLTGMVDVLERWGHHLRHTLREHEMEPIEQFADILSNLAGGVESLQRVLTAGLPDISGLADWETQIGDIMDMVLRLAGRFAGMAQLAPTFQSVLLSYEEKGKYKALWEYEIKEIVSPLVAFVGFLKAVGEGLSSAVQGLTALGTYVPIGDITARMTDFGNDLVLALNKLSVIADAYAGAKVEDLYATLNGMGQALAGAVEGLTTLGAYVAQVNLADAVGYFKADLDLAMAKLLDMAAQYGAENPEMVRLLSTLSGIGGAIGSAVEGLVTLGGYDKALPTGAISRFATDVKGLLSKLGELAAEVAPNLTQPLLTFLDVLSRIGDAILGVREALLAIESYWLIPNMGEMINRFLGDVALLLNGLNTLQQGTTFSAGAVGPGAAMPMAAGAPGRQVIVVAPVLINAEEYRNAGGQWDFKALGDYLLSLERSGV